MSELRWGAVVIAALLVLVAVGGIVLLSPGNEKEYGTLVVMSPNSTDRLMLKEGSYTVEDIIGMTGGALDGYKHYCITDDGDIFQVTGAIEVSVREGGCFTGPEREVMGLFRGAEVSTTMSLARTALSCLNLTTPGPPLIWADVERVIVIELDGLGFIMYDEIKQDLFGLSMMRSVMPAVTGYPPITNVGTATAITGHPPSDHGIKARKDHTLLKPTFLDIGRISGLSTAWIEGDSGFLDAGMINHVDSDGDGTIDDEIHQGVIDEIDLGTEVILGHYHSIDDAGHHYGPGSPEHTERIREVDAYLEEIIAMLENGSRPSLLMVFSDHGMHADEDGRGVHGEMRHEDMFSIVGYSLLGGASPLPEPGLTVSDGNSTDVEISLEEFRGLDPVESTVVLKGSNGVWEGICRGVNLSTLKELYFPGEITSIRLTASDGYSMLIPGEYADEGSGVFLAYEKDGAPLGDDGPLRLIVPQSVAGEYNGQECLKSVARLEVQR